jgi:class 3 adenylate cyclase
MLSQKEITAIIACINDALNRAERHWRNGGHTLVKSAAAMDSALVVNESAPSHIPGHIKVQEDETVIDEFIALVADMRDSSKHLNSAISEKTAKVSQLQRVYYETSALLPALAMTIKLKEGNVTEYLGDGVLALFQVDPKDKSKAIYAAHAAAVNCIGETRELVNAALAERYSLPALDLGVGLAMSKTIVTLIGLPGEKHPKAFGECVFRATKLSSGKNEIYVDTFVRGSWPTSKEGKLRFVERSKGDVPGYLISL